MRLMTTVELHSTGIAIIWMEDGENRISTAFLASFNNSLSSAVAQACTAIVVASRTRWWSNGVDLTEAQTSQAQGEVLMHALAALCARLLSLDCPLVACVNGHCYGGGLLFSMAFDFRVASSSKGFLCMPAVNLGVRLPSGLIGLLRHKVGDGIALRDICLLGERLPGQVCTVVDLEWCFLTSLHWHRKLWSWVLLMS
jgi:enoyl-CoA hydratase/carnithine racemase